MRATKTMAAALLLTLSALSTVGAQGTRGFRDSWFWGIEGGVASYTGANTIDPTIAGSQSVAPVVGLDWLITRTKGGLYLSYNQAFLTATGVILNGPTSADTGFRAVNVENVRRVNLAAMAFPGDYIKWHPYVGVGIRFDYLAGAEPVIVSTDGQRQVDYALSATSDVKAALGPMFIAGAQYRVKFLSVFGQFTTSAMAKDYLLANGHTIGFSGEFGVRYNIGSSIER